MDTTLLRQRRGANERIAALQDENARLAAFARQIIECAFDGRDADGGTIQSLALAHGLVRLEAYDPARHGGTLEEVRPGDDWYVCVGAVAKAPVE